MGSESPLTPSRALHAPRPGECREARRIPDADDQSSAFLFDLAESIAGACMQSLYIDPPQQQCNRDEVVLHKPDGHFRRLHEIEADIIRLAFIRYDGRVSEIARRLHVSRSTMYRKLDAIGLGSEKPAS